MGAGQTGIHGQSGRALRQLGLDGGEPHGEALARARDVVGPCGDHRQRQVAAEERAQQARVASLRFGVRACRGFEVVEAPLPCLITVTSELGEPRYAPLKGIMKAAKIQPTIWKPADVGLEPDKIGAKGRRTKLAKLFQPVKEGKCEIVEGENVADAAAKLAIRLREAKVL